MQIADTHFHLNIIMFSVSRVSRTQNYSLGWLETSVYVYTHIEIKKQAEMFFFSVSEKNAYNKNVFTPQ